VLAYKRSRIDKSIGDLALGGVLFLAVLALPRAVLAQPENGEKVYDRTLRATVCILTPRGAMGSGSLIDREERLIISNYHVVGADDDRVVVFFPHFENGKLISERSAYKSFISKGGGIRGKVLYRDDRRDLAVIRLEKTKLPANTAVLRLAPADVRPGQTVHSIGNPGSSGAFWVYTQGSVRAVYNKKWRSMLGRDLHEFEARVVETQSPTNPGDSGGPLVNDKGELIGVTQGFKQDAQLLSLFIDVSEVRSFLKEHNKLPKNSLVASAESGSASQDTEKSSDKVKPLADELERKAARKLKLADQLKRDGKLEKAKDWYQEIIDEFPKTEAAAKAKTLLDDLKDK
jgi:S1-C subfamily serine protease